MKNDSKADKYYCYILPWLNLKGEIKIGAVTFKPFDHKKLDDGTNQKLIESLNKSFEHFIMQNGKATDQAAVCFYQDQCIFDQNFEGEQNIREAVDTLTFLIISRLNVLRFCGKGLMGQPPSAEKFKLAIVPLYKDKNNKNEVFYKAGVLIPCFNVDTFYYDLEPFQAGYIELTKNQYNSKLLELFNSLIKSPRNKEVERILRSLTWFRYSQTESTEVDPFSRILMKMTAFEILLKLPDGGARLTFMEDIDKYYVEIASKETPAYKFIKDKKEIPRRQCGTTTNEEKNQSKLAWWAYDFYKLRSRIVHGDHLEPKDMKRDDQKYNELIIADIVFSWIITEKLMQLYGPKEDGGDDKKKIEKIMYDSSLRDIYFDAFKAAGWIVENIEVDHQSGFKPRFNNS